MKHCFAKSIFASHVQKIEVYLGLTGSIASVLIIYLQNELFWNLCYFLRVAF